MLRSLFVLAIFVPGFIAALGDRFAALLMYLWFALFRPQDWLWVDVTGLRLSLVLGIVLVVPAFLTGILPNISHSLTIGMALFLASSLLAQIGAVDPALGWHWIDFTGRLLLTCMLLVTLVVSPRRLLLVIAVIAASLGFHAAKAGLAWLLGGGDTRFADGFAGSFVDSNGYALGAVMIMPLLLTVAQNMSVLHDGPALPWLRRAFYAAIPLCGFMILGTYSRGGFVALSAAALTYVLLQRRRFVAIAVGLAMAALALVVVPIPESYVKRIETIRTYDEIGETSALSRRHFWRVGVQMGLSRPFGVGLRQYEEAYNKYDFSDGRFGTHRAVHSSHVQVFAELGAFGAAIWIAMFARSFFICMRVRRQSRRAELDPATQRLLFTVANGLITSMVGFLIGGAFLSAALNDITWLTFACVAALDRISSRLCAELADARSALDHQVPFAFRAVESFASTKGVNS